MESITNEHKLFNVNVEPMKQVDNFGSSFIQFLVLNYIKEEYNTRNVFVYPELIEDLDVMASDIRTHERLYERSKKRKLTIRAFLQEIPDEDYLESYEVKHGESFHITEFKNLKQLLTKIRFPINTRLVLALVPSGWNFNKDLIINTDMFNNLKEQILSLEYEDKKKVFNSIINDTSLGEMSITDALSCLLDDLENENLKDYGNKNISDEIAEILINNFERLDVKVLVLEELERDIKKSTIHDVLREILTMKEVRKNK